MDKPLIFQDAAAGCPGAAMGHVVWDHLRDVATPCVLALSPDEDATKAQRRPVQHGSGRFSCSRPACAVRTQSMSQTHL